MLESFFARAMLTSCGKTPHCARRGALCGHYHVRLHGHTPPRREENTTRKFGRTRHSSLNDLFRSVKDNVKSFALAVTLQLRRQRRA